MYITTTLILALFVIVWLYVNAKSLSSENWVLRCDAYNKSTQIAVLQGENDALRSQIEALKQTADSNKTVAAILSKWHDDGLPPSRNIR